MYPDFFFGMLTVYDVLEIVGNDGKRTKWMDKYTINASCSECLSCGGAMESYSHRGKQAMRCSNTSCRKIVSAVLGGLMAGSHLSEKVWTMVMGNGPEKSISVARCGLCAPWASMKPGES